MPKDIKHIFDDDKIRKALEAVARLVEADAMGRCPVVTGHLKGSIGHKVIGDTAYIGTNVEYACVYGAATSVYDPVEKSSQPIGSYSPNYILSKDGKIHAITLKHKFYQKQLKIVKITAHTRRKPLNVTENHLILILRDDNLEWCEAKKLKLTDLVFTKRANNYISDNSNKKEFTCACGNNFFVEKSALKYRSALYCSQECYHRFTNHNRALGKRWKLQENQKRYLAENPQWKGGISKDPYDWRWNKTLKKYVRERDGSLCQLCDSKKDLVIHHKDGNKENSIAENLITLCRRCHGYVTQGKLYCELPDVNLDVFKPISIKKIEKYSIRRRGKSNIGRIYDFSIKGENSYYAAGLLIHNSYVEYGTIQMEKAHGLHSVEHPVTSWKALRERGGSGQTMPFLRPAVFHNKDRILEKIKEELSKP